MIDTQFTHRIHAELVGKTIISSISVLHVRGVKISTSTLCVKSLTSFFLIFWAVSTVSWELIKCYLCLIQRYIIQILVSTKTKVQVYSGLQGRMCLEIFMGPFKCINPVSVPPSTLLVTTVRPECDRADGNIMTDKAVRWQSRPRPGPDLNSRLTLLMTCHQQTNKQTQILSINIKW